jgi:hypothetical protein
MYISIPASRHVHFDPRVMYMYISIPATRGWTEWNHCTSALNLLNHQTQAGMMVSLGYELQGCGILVTLAAIAGTAAWLLFLGGCCWVCTRPWTGSLLIIVAFLGNIAIETQQPASVVMWLVFATAFCYVWSVWGSQLAPDERPKRDEERERLLPNA